MELQMSEHEICQMYRDAKDKNEQISILADLNVCDSGTIIDVLSRNGFVPGLPVKSKTARNGFKGEITTKTGSKKRKPATQFTAETCAEIEKLYASGIWTGQIAERLGLDYKAVANKISNMGLPKKYNQNKSDMQKAIQSDNADKLYIQTLEETLKEKDEALKKVSTNCDAYKIELDKLMEENELLREADKYREDFDGIYNSLKDARLLIDLVLATACGDDDSAVYHGLVRANDIITSAMCELRQRKEYEK